MRVDRDTVKSIPVFFYSVIITSEFVFPGMNPYRSSDVPVKCMRLIPLYLAFYRLRANNVVYVDRVIYGGRDYMRILFPGL